MGFHEPQDGKLSSILPSLFVNLATSSKPFPNRVKGSGHADAADSDSRTWSA